MVAQKVQSSCWCLHCHQVQRARCICKEENLAPCAYYSKSQVVHTGWEFLQVWMSFVSYKKSQHTRHGLAACCTPKLHILRQSAALSPSLFKYSQLDECKNGNKYSGDRRVEINHPAGKLDFAQDTFDSPAPTCFCALRVYAKLGHYLHEGNRCWEREDIMALLKLMQQLLCALSRTSSARLWRINQWE